MERWEGKIAVITGASSGLGLATAQALVKEGMIVVGLARRKAKMENEINCVHEKGDFYAYECDVTCEENVKNAFEWIEKNIGVVQVLVNNAAVMIPGKIVGNCESSRKVWETVINTNVIGVLECTKHAVTVMKQTNVEGHIININSIEGHNVHLYPNLYLGVYPGTKYGMRGITEHLRKELFGGKIRISSISPGFINTDIINALENKESKPLLKPEDVAKAVVYVIGTLPHIQVTELIIRPLGETV